MTQTHSRWEKASYFCSTYILLCSVSATIVSSQVTAMQCTPVYLVDAKRICSQAAAAVLCERSLEGRAQT